MGPANDHELEIARSVDRIDMEGRLNPTVLGEIVTALGFILSQSDCDFLVQYVRWRMANPIVR